MLNNLIKFIQYIRRFKQWKAEEATVGERYVNGIIQL